MRVAPARIVQPSDRHGAPPGNWLCPTPGPRGDPGEREERRGEEGDLSYLDARGEAEEGQRDVVIGQPYLREPPGEAEPVHQAEDERQTRAPARRGRLRRAPHVERDQHQAERDARLRRRARDVDQAERGGAEREAVRHGERRLRPEHRAHLLQEQHQREEEEQVIVSREDVHDPELHVGAGERRSGLGLGQPQRGLVRREDPGHAGAVVQGDDEDRLADDGPEARHGDLLAGDRSRTLHAEGAVIVVARACGTDVQGSPKRTVTLSPGVWARTWTTAFPGETSVTSTETDRVPCARALGARSESETKRRSAAMEIAILISPLPRRRSERRSAASD